MSSVIGSLRVNLGLDSAKFESGARRVASPLAAMKKQFVAVTAVAVAMGAAISTLALKGANDIDHAAKSARRLGTSIGGFRALEMAAGEAGVSLSALTNDVQTMDREIAKGSKGATDALTALGITAADLEGLEADEKIALIADQIKELGLNSGQASVLLQGLGVRNREMVLAVLGGGDAFRQARKDAKDYGLAVSEVDSAAIEQANDRIGRLGYIGQYAAQQLAISLVPTMGALAQAMTDSLREGGLLRTVIDGIIGSLDVMAYSAGVAVTAFGVRYVAAFAAAQLATFSLSGALVVLRTALIRTGIGALIVGAGYLISKFVDLVSAAGGFGKAMGLLGDVAAAVWKGIVDSASAIPPALDGVWNRMKGGFLLALSGMATSFHDFAWTIASGMSGIEGFDVISSALMGVADAASEVSGSLARAGHAANGDAAGAFSNAGAKITAAFGPARAAVAALSGAMNDAKNSTDETTESVTDLGAALNDAGAGGESGGGSGGKAVDGLKEKVSSLKDAATEMKDTFKEAFKGLITGAKSFGDVVKDVLSKIADMLLDSAFDDIFSVFSGGKKSGSGGGFLSGIMDAIFPSAKGNVFSNGSAVKAFAKGGVVNGATTFPMRGNQTGLMGESGPEAIVPLSRGSDGRLGIQSQGAQGLNVTVTMDPSTGALGAFVTDRAGQVVAQAAPSIASQSVSQAQASFKNSKSGWSP